MAVKSPDNKISISDCIVLVIACITTDEVIKTADKEVGENNKVYLTIRPILIQAILNSSYKAIKVECSSSLT
jgi:hypothetical protein